MAQAREYLKKRKTIKINMAARLLSRVAFHSPLSFLSRISVHQKMPKNVLKNALLSTSPDVVKLRAQFAVLTAPTSEREDCRDLYGRRLCFEFPGRWNAGSNWSVCSAATDTGNTTTIARRKRSVLTKEEHSEWRNAGQDSWNKGVEGKEEIRVSRNGRRLVLTEEKRNPSKSGVV